MNKALRVEVRVKNNRLYKAIHAKWPSVATFAKERKHSYHLLMMWMGFRSSPWLDDINISERAIQVCLDLEVPPEELFPQNLYVVRGSKFKVLEVDTLTKARELIATAPDTLLELKQADEMIPVLGKTARLLDREMTTINYLVNQQTLEQTAKTLRVTRERVRQIGNKAVRKIRNAATWGRLKHLGIDSCRKPLI